MTRSNPQGIRRFDPAVVASIVLILVVTLVPVDGPHEVHLRPLRDISAAFSRPLHPSRLLGVLGNVMLFAPLGAALGARRFQRLRTVGIGLALSIMIEVAQLFVPGRTTSFDDVLLNTLGVLIGYSLVARRLGSGRAT